MRLLVVSHTPHHRSGDRLVGWGPTVRELDHLAGLFGELVHLAPVHDGPAPASGLSYRAANVRVVPVRPAGGEGLGAKLGILRALPQYVQTIWRELDRADVVHVRCPSNIGFVATVLLMIRRRPTPRWIKYAGNWNPQDPESFSYRLQRWLLSRRVSRSLVTVNGRWPGQPDHVRSFLNPCLTDDELREGAAVARAKTLGEPLRLLFVGRVDEEKGCGRALEILGMLRSGGTEAVLEIIGDGPDRRRFEAQAAAAGLDGHVHFRGWVPRQALSAYYREAHVLLLPSSSSEGWPKVLSEAMAYGAVPVTSDVSSIPQLLQTFRAGRALPAKECAAFAAAIRGYASEPAAWTADSQNAVEAAKSFSYDAYLDAVRQLLRLRAA
jgi:glycosyltransferase involved in cell wall biosynthesis